MSRFKMGIIGLGFFLALPLPAFAEYNYTGVEDSYNAHLGAGAATGLKRTGLFNNPASHDANTRGFSLSYRNPFQMESVSQIHMGAFWDFPNWGLACNIHQFKIEDLYVEQHFQPQTSMRIAGWLQLGLAANLHRVEIQEFEGTYSSSLIAGAILSYSKIKLGLIYKSPIIRKENIESIKATVYQGGIQINLKNSQLAMDVSYDFQKGFQRKFSQNFIFSKYLEFSYGITDIPFQLSLGISLNLGSLTLSPSSQYHPRLGFSNSYLLSGSSKNCPRSCELRSTLPQNPHL